MVTDQERIMEVFLNAYEDLFGMVGTHDSTLDLHYFRVEEVDLSELDVIFMKEELSSVIKEISPDRIFGQMVSLRCFVREIEELSSMISWLPFSSCMWQMEGALPSSARY